MGCVVVVQFLWAACGCKSSGAANNMSEARNLVCHYKPFSLLVLFIGVYDEEARREYAVMTYAARARRRRIDDARCLPPGRRPLVPAPQQNTPSRSTFTKLPLLRQQPFRRPVPRVVDGVVARVDHEVGHGPVARARVARVQDAVIKREERPAGHARRDQFKIRR
jgi:hypothetical protein